MWIASCTVSIIAVATVGKRSHCYRKTLHQGQNQGRSFHTCPKPQKEQCDFFEWADVPLESGQGCCNKTRTRPVSIADDGNSGPVPENRAPPIPRGNQYCNNSM